MHVRKENDGTAEVGSRSPRSATPERPGGVWEVARLQRAVGNQVVLSLLASKRRAPTGGSVPAVQRRVLKGGEKPEEITSFKQGESQAEIEDTASQLERQHGQQNLYYRDVQNLLLTETEYIVEHGNALSIGGSNPAAVAGSMAGKMSKSTDQPYRIVFYSCEGGAGIDAPAGEVQKILHDTHGVNSEITAPRGLVHRVSGEDLVHTAMFKIRGTKSESGDFGGPPGDDWMIVTEEEWNDIRGRIADACVAQLVSEAAVKIDGMDGTALGYLVHHLGGHEHLKSQAKSIGTLLQPKAIKTKQTNAKQFLQRMAQQMNAEKLIEVIGSYRDLDAAGTINLYAAQAWQQKAELMKLTSQEPDQQQLLLPGPTSWQTFKTAVAAPAHTPMTAALAHGTGDDLAARLRRLRAANQGRADSDSDSD